MAALDNLEENFEEYLNRLISEYGSGTVAEMIGIDSPRMTRFRGGEAGLTIQQIEKLLEIKGTGLVQRGQLTKYREHLIMTVDILR